MNDGVTRAACGWSGEDQRWHLRIVLPEIVESPVEVFWEGAAAPPTLMDRYDGLADLGYAVVQGGPEAWEWCERLDDAGRTHLIGVTEVRPLTDEEAAVRLGVGAPELE
ncbi:DUF6303 family protein [Streptomyces sp. ME01-18h]|uniref:DUF6303 family protein n=1 Tax=Streptomyces sp. ME01-18h TaxID=462920 RepID=UPI0029B1D5D9|nr:DUF6303 family protein [Streptomyces sp. ME01-18h]MDX3400070.1 DUF6303 family protein [Streptomyces sp. ME01-18h]